ncbi:glucose-6-phosphate isomerase, partial [Ascosphaera atra]
SRTSLTMATSPYKWTPTDLASWKALKTHYDNNFPKCPETGKPLPPKIILKDLCQDPARFDAFTRTFKHADDEVLFDFSKNLVTEETLDLLVKLAQEANVEGLRDNMFAGKKINNTEGRAVFHVGLRNVSAPESDLEGLEINGQNPVKQVRDVLSRMEAFSNKVRSGEWRGYTGKKIDTIINIGIGGSDLYVTSLNPSPVLPLSLPFFPLLMPLAAAPSWSQRPSSLMATLT